MWGVCVHTPLRPLAIVATWRFLSSAPIYNACMKRAAMFGVLLLAGCGSTGAVDDGGVPDGSAKDGAGGADASVDAPGDALGDAPASDSGGDGGVDAGPGTYAAYGLAGGLDRVRIAKTVGGTCFMLGLVWPGNNPGGLTLPAQWGFEYARAVQPAAACNPAYLGPISGMFDATSRSGSVSWSGMGIPSTIQSVNVTLNFAGAPVWCPASEVLTTSNLPVQ